MLSQAKFELGLAAALAEVADVFQVARLVRATNMTNAYLDGVSDKIIPAYDPANLPGTVAPIRRHLEAKGYSALDSATFVVYAKKAYPAYGAKFFGGRETLLESVVDAGEAVASGAGRIVSSAASALAPGAKKLGDSISSPLMYGAIIVGGGLAGYLLVTSGVMGKLKKRIA